MRPRIITPFFVSNRHRLPHPYFVNPGPRVSWCSPGSRQSHSHSQNCLAFGAELPIQVIFWSVSRSILVPGEVPGHKIGLKHSGDHAISENAPHRPHHTVQRRIITFAPESAPRPHWRRAPRHYRNEPPCCFSFYPSARRWNHRSTFFLKGTTTHY